MILGFLYMRNPTPVNARKSPFKVVGHNLLQIAKMPQMWIAALWGGIAFGLNLALGVVWTPKIFTNAGLTLDNGNVGSALLWLGLAAGSCFWPKATKSYPEYQSRHANPRGDFAFTASA